MENISLRHTNFFQFLGWGTVVGFDQGLKVNSNLKGAKWKIPLSSLFFPISSLKKNVLLAFILVGCTVPWVVLVCSCWFRWCSSLTLLAVCPCLAPSLPPPAPGWPSPSLPPSPSPPPGCWRTPGSSSGSFLTLECLFSLFLLSSVRNVNTRNI